MIDQPNDIAGPDPTPTVRPGLLTEHGEPMKSPFEAQEIEIPSLRTGRGGATAGFQSIGAVLARLALPAGADGEGTTDHRERLLYLAHHVGPTGRARQAVERIERQIADHEAVGLPVDAELRATLAHWSRRHDDARERDEILRSREPDCEPWCLGLGGREEVGIVVRDPDDPERVLFAEANPPMTWQEYCGCADGRRAREQARAEREAMRERGMARRARKLLGEARIPVEYRTHTLDTYPDQAVAEKVARWYRTNLAEVGVATEERTVKPFLLLAGPNRRGKTGLAIGVVKLAIEVQAAAVFRTVPDLLDELRGTYDKDNPACHADLLAALKDVSLLVLDDLGAEAMTAWVATTMFSLLDYRGNHHKITVLTTNLGWKDARQYDPTEMPRELGERIFWRIRSASNTLPIIGPLLGVNLATPRHGPTADDLDILE